jgi:hypothetical protein
MTAFDTTGLLVLSVGAALLGLVLLLGGRTSPRRRGLTLGLMALLATGLAVVAPRFDGLSHCRWPLLGLAGASVVCLLLAFASPERLLARFMRLAARPQVQGLVLLTAGLLLLVAWPWYAEWATGDSRLAPNDAVNARLGTDDPETYRTLWTDAGEAVRVYDLQGQPAFPEDRIAEEQLKQFPDTALHLMRTAPADRSYNCHGWVFTDGRYLVDGADVDRILNDNGYVPVTTPREGDLIVYKDSGVHICHSGIVRAVTDDGLVLVESKWTSMGRFLHPPEAYLPGTPRIYYRSPRNGHWLRGVNKAPSVNG